MPGTAGALRRRRLLPWAPALLVALLVALGGPAPARATAVDKILIYGLDGWTNECSDICNPPGLAEMIQHGSYSPRVRAHWPGHKATNWASLLMGGGVPFHGIITDDVVIPNGCSGPPTLFDAVKEWSQQTHQARRTIFSCSDRVVQYLMPSRLSIDETESHYSIFDSPDRLVNDLGVPGDRLLMVWQIPQLLTYGINEHFCSPNYCHDMSIAFNLIQAVHTGLEAAAPHDTVLSIAVSMLGGYDNYYGLNLREPIVRVPLVVRGYNIRTNYRMIENYMNSDVNLLALAAMDLAPPGDWYGKVMSEVWGGTPQPRMNTDLGSCRYNYDLSIDPDYSEWVIGVLVLLIVGLLLGATVYFIYVCIQRRRQRRRMSYNHLAALS